MNWKILLIVVIVNTLLCLLQYVVQQIDVRKGRIQRRGTFIPGTNQKFLYWQDFKAQAYGDFIFLPLLAYVFSVNWSTVIAPFFGSTAIVFFITFAVFAAVTMGFVCTLPGHKPDWGYPKPGKISWGGFSHLPYFGIYCAIALYLVITMIQGKLTGLNLALVIIGGAGYAITWIVDLFEGNFEKLKPIK